MKHKRVIRFIGALLLAILVLSLSVTAFAEEKSLTEAQLAELTASLADDQKELPVDEKFRVAVDARDLSVTPGLDEAWMNILLLGTDTGDLRLNYGRTDAMMVLSLNVETGDMKLVSLVRDLLVDIPYMQIKNRINTANAFGGPLLAVKTVNEVLGLNIQHYCSINFKGFEEVIDDLGGVTLTLSGGEAADTGAKNTTEPQLLNGKQALNYVRIRRLDDNFGRNERQRKLLASVLGQVKQSGYEQMMAAVTAGFKAIATNLSTSEVIGLLPVVLSSSGQLEMLSLPRTGEYRLATTEAGASVVEYDEEQLRQAFHTFVYGVAE